MPDMRRREFITLIGGAAVAWPLAARAQQSTPVIGFINSQSPDRLPSSWLSAFRQGLKEAGYVDGQNLTIEYRWAAGQYERVPALAADLVRRNVAVMAVTGGDVITLAAKSVNATIPIVFSSGYDPVKLGLVESLARPGGNLTGVSVIAGALGAKRLGLLREVAPKAAVIAVLVHPDNPSIQRDVEDVTKVAAVISARIEVVTVRTDTDVDAAFASIVREHADALMVNPDPSFMGRRERLIALAEHHAIPTIYYSRDYPVAGGLMSYGASFADSYRQVGTYTGRILKGEKPADLPVIQPTKFELVINLRTARALGLEIPDKLLALADEVIE
jgi:putative ABC transport system substrate-binding protein